MYRILAASDSHGKTEYVSRELEAISGINKVIHLGDYISDAKSLEKQFPHLSFEYVKGNCDAYAFGEREKLLELENKKIFITHGDMYGVKSGYDRLAYRAQELGADCVLFGHTHMAKVFSENGILFLNPGAAGKNSIGIIEIENEKIRGCIIDIM